MARHSRIALLIESHRTYERNLLRGIAAYAHVHGPWSFFQQVRAPGNVVLTRLEKWGGDGLIMRCESRKLIQHIQKLNIPTVDLLGWYDLEDIPTLDTDHRAVAHMAADHLIEHGFEQFAYCGFDGLYYSERRREYFTEYLSELGYKVSVFQCPRQSHDRDSSTFEAHGVLDAEALAAWVASLPKPVGLMACNDARGEHVLDACSQCGIVVPDETAVIAVGNDDVVCDLCAPTLSSIEPNTRKMGYEAAALLDRMISGEDLPTVKILVGPLDVITRQSTDVLTIADGDVAAAMHFIREHAAEGVNVEDVLEHVGVSRSTLERRFARFVGRSPKAEIIRAQLHRVKQLLSRTDYPLVKIAQLAGFNHVEYMCNIFKDKTGQTPGQYRKQSQV